MKHFLLSVLAAFFLFTGSVAAQADQTVTLRNLQGESIRLETDGKPTVLAIGASWLPLSRKQIEVVNQLQQNFGKRGVTFYFVSTEPDAVKARNYVSDEQLKEFGERNKLSVLLVRDVAGTSVKLYKLDQILAFVVLDKTGKVAGVVSGFGDSDDVSSQISDYINKILR